MCIILCKATYTCQSVQFTTLLITANRTEFSQAQRQILIWTRGILINHTVVRTVHRFQEVLLSFFGCMNRLEWILTIFSIVTGSYIQQLVTNRRSNNLLIIVTCLNTAQEFLQTQTQCSTFRQPHRQAFTYCIREHEQIHFLTDFAMVTFLGFFQNNQIFIQHLFLRESNTVDTRHHLAVFMSTPVSTGYRHQFDSLNRRSSHQVRATAQIRKSTLRISSNVTIFQFRDQFTFISFSTITEFCQCIRFWNTFSHNSFFLCYQFCHFSLNRRKVRFFNSSLTRIHIIVETVFNGRTNTELNTRI